MGQQGLTGSHRRRRNETPGKASRRRTWHPLSYRQLLLEKLEDRRLLSGMALIAHDAISRVDKWVDHNVVEAADVPVTQSIRMESPPITGTINGHQVSIDRYDAPGEPVDPSERTWLVIHGNSSAPTFDYIDRLASAIHSASSGDQVLTLDWSKIAALRIWETEDHIIPVAEWASVALTSHGFSGGLLNPVGHSFGSYVAAELAERIAGGVNTIVGLDPAEDWPGGYDPEEPGEVAFSEHSQFSWVFSDAGGLRGSGVTPGSAHEAFVVENSGHNLVVDLFSNMLSGVGNADVWQHYSLSRLLDHGTGPWVPNQYDQLGNPSSGGEYEAVITSEPGGEVALSIQFQSPPLIADAGGPYAGGEGSPITLDASGSQSIDESPLQFRWDFQNDGTWDTDYSTSPTAAHTWPDDHTGDVAVEVYDGEVTVIDTATVTVTNVPPTVDSGPDRVVQEGDALNLGLSTAVPLLTPTNPQPSVMGQFGSALALDRESLVVGARWDDTAGPNAGVVYRFDAHTGDLLQTFQPVDPQGGEFFGQSVAVSGTKVLVGSPHQYSSSGSVYLFDTSSSKPLFSVQDPDPQVNDCFGNRVTFFDGNLLVAAARPDGVGNVYLFDATTGDPTPLVTFSDPLPNPRDWFGHALGVWGEYVVIGENYADVNGTDVGAVHIFDGSSGDLVRTVLNPTPASNDLFGFSLAVQDNRVLIGAPYDSHDYPSAHHAGTAYLFDANTGEMIRTFQNPAPAPGANFGVAVELLDDYAIIGGTHDRCDGADGPGKAYLFDVRTGDLLQVLEGPTPESGNSFGSPIAASSDRFAVAASLATDAASGRADAGATHLFLAPHPGATLTDPGLDDLTNAAAETFTGTIDWGDGSPVEDATVTWISGQLGSPTLGAVTGSHLYAEQGAYVVTVTVADDDGGSHAENMVVTVLGENNRPVVDVGDHVLLPNTPGQVIPIYVSGGSSVQGTVFNVQIDDGFPDVPGSATDGPNIANVDLVEAGTVFDSSANTGNNVIESREQIWVVGTTTTDGVVHADGVLAYVTIDTTGWFGDDGSWQLKVAGTHNGDTNFQSPDGQVFPVTTNGTITIDNLPVAVPGGPYAVKDRHFVF